MNSLKKIAEFIRSSILYVFYTLKVHRIDFFNYRKLIYTQYPTPYGVSSVMLYGNWKAVAKLKNSRFKFLNEYLEHGMCFYTSTESAEYLGYINRPHIKRIYTYGNVRKQVLDNYLKEKNLNDRNVVAIGPYILGAKHFYSETKLQNIKKEYGKILLIFPSHSFDDVKTNYEVSNFAKAIENIRPQFDSVFVCMYWKDIVDKPAEVEFYEKQGYKVVCSGHRSDPKFLSRQKDLIFLSDMVMTNDIGSHVGYAVCMNRPLFFFSQELDLTKQKLDETDNSKNLVREKCKSLFSDFSFSITQDQKDFVEEYWGKYIK